MSGNTTAQALSANPNTTRYRGKCWTSLSRSTWSRAFCTSRGRWRNDAQRAAHARQTADFEDYVTLVYSARAVNAVLSSESGEPLKARVWLDGEYLTEGNRGADVTIGPDGESYVRVNQSRMYQLVENPNYVQRQKLKLSANPRRLWNIRLHLRHLRRWPLRKAGNARCSEVPWG